MSDRVVQLSGEAAFYSYCEQSDGEDDKRNPSELHFTNGAVWWAWVAHKRQEADSDDESSDDDLCTALEVPRAEQESISRFIKQFCEKKF